MPKNGRSMEQSLTSAQGYVRYILSAKGIALPPLPRTCLIDYSNIFLEEAKKRFPVYQMVDIGSRKPEEVYFFRKSHGNDFSIITPQYGDAMAAMTLEELAALQSGKTAFHRFLSMGTAGHPTAQEEPALPVGRIVLVRDALSYEGTSPHYAENDRPQAHEGINRKLRSVLQRRGVNFTEGTVATTPAIYRETPSFIRDAIERGACVLDMETSALLTVARYLDRPIGTLLYVSDIVQMKKGESGWDVQFLSGDVTKAEEALFGVFLDFVDES